MLKKRLVGAATAVALLLILVPVPSQAAPWTWIQLPGPASALFAKAECWWTLLLGGPERSSRTERPAVWQKNGCGMDPNGVLVCEPGASQGTSAPTGPDGSN